MDKKFSPAKQPLKWLMQQYFCKSRIKFSNRNMMQYIKELKAKLFTEVTAVPAFLQGPYYQSLDGLRGLAILIVLLAHFDINHFLRPFALFMDSSIGVHIFLY